jgi:hypothetical protein
MGLRIVQYDPNDYKLGEALALASGESIEDSERISQILSLYFQWKESALCWAYTTKDKSARSKALLSYDEEERVATQLFVEVDKSALSPGAEWVFLRLEIFENCFEFEVKLLDQFEENGKDIYIVLPPEKVSVIKNRRYPRVTALPDSKIEWRDNNGTNEYRVEHLSLGSLVIEAHLPINQSGIVVAKGTSYPAVTTRNFDGKTSLKMQMPNNMLIGAWFDYYRLHAFQGLKKRSECNSNLCIDLYHESGYFSKYKPAELELILSEIENSWRDLECLDHIATADYVVCKDDKLSGMGSSSYTYTHKGKDFWTFHSLCTLKNESDLDLSRNLYAWRAVYNFSRIENMDTLLFFASSSRWIERIYVNFLQRKSQSNVNPVRLYTIRLKPIDHGLTVTSNKFTETTERLMCSDENIVAAALPDLLHIRKRLNCIDVLSSDADVAKALTYGEQLAFSAKQEISFRLSVPFAHPWQTDIPLDPHTDRMGVLRKEDLIDFIASLDHSIEVTKRKKKIA